MSASLHLLLYCLQLHIWLVHKSIVCDLTTASNMKDHCMKTTVFLCSLWVTSLSLPRPILLYSCICLLLDCACYGRIGMYRVCKYRGTMCLYLLAEKDMYQNESQVYDSPSPPSYSLTKYCEFLHVSLLWIIIMYLFIRQECNWVLRVLILKRFHHHPSQVVVHRTQDTQTSQCALTSLLNREQTNSCCLCSLTQWRSWIT